MSTQKLIVPLKPAALHILAALAEGEGHGYALMQRIRARTGGAVPVQTGSFYRHLSRLMDAGLVQTARGPAGDDPRRGAYYHLSPEGRRVLAAERRRLADLLAVLRPRRSRV